MFTCEGLFDGQFRKYLLFFKPSLLWKSVCILTWELRSSRIILWCKRMKQFLKYNFFQIVITFEIRLHAYLQNTWQEDYLIKETKDPFLHVDFDSMDMFTRVTVENALLCFTTPNILNWLSLHNRMTCELSTRRFYPERPETSLELLPSVSGSSIKNGFSSLSWSTLIVFLRNELDTWAIASLAKPSSTPNRSF